ncbi:MAG: desulfoferrodoxin [Deltaproteobacteria bacterium]|jgi:superoxide reductase|nr:desulfoferrodoxin [Deltaproteobacteria bacterium]MBW1854631.1 desulfoferrodoxin [Deltaproteobacteria bacterium]MBW2183239.1 desulfoferrodoxin [Deltaproteobacteria bacterium]MCK5257414.1 desulfoferrodoxin [Deltaproteobacteria bacterium]
MTTRREFLGGSFLAASVVALGALKPASASSQTFSGIIYTKSNPGKWSKKIGSHAPQVSSAGNKVTITTAHPMSQEHYIVRHTLVLEDGTVVGAKTFYPLQDTKAVSTLELPAGYKAKFYATSFCNLHDLWVTESQA